MLRSETDRGCTPAVREAEAAKIRTIIVDDHPILRFGLRELLGREHGIDVVGDASSVVGAMELVRAERPDVAVIAVGLPHQSGILAVEWMRREHPSTRCIVLTTHDDPSLARTAFAAGAHAYVLKRSIDRQIVIAVRSAYDGRQHIDPAIADNLSPLPQCTNGVALSTRERQVLRRVALGYTSATIAKELGLSPKSVESYRARIRHKLGLESRADIVRYALELGIVGPTTAPVSAALLGDTVEK